MADCSDQGKQIRGENGEGSKILEIIRSATIFAVDEMNHETAHVETTRLGEPTQDGRKFRTAVHPLGDDGDPNRGEEIGKTMYYETEEAAKRGHDIVAAYRKL